MRRRVALVLNLMVAVTDEDGKDDCEYGRPLESCRGPGMGPKTVGWRQ